MSTESAEALASRFKSDAGFRARIIGAAGPSTRAQMIMDEGFNIDETDIPSLQHAFADFEQLGEMSDAELEGVTGGGSGTVNICSSGFCLPEGGW